MTEIYIATEDVLSEAVADRLVLEVNQGLRVAVRMGRKGNGYLKSKILDLSKYRGSTGSTMSNALPSLIVNSPSDRP